MKKKEEFSSSRIFFYIIHKSCLFFASDLLYNGAPRNETERKRGREKDDTQATIHDTAVVDLSDINPPILFNNDNSSNDDDQKKNTKTSLSI